MFDSESNEIQKTIKQCDGIIKLWSKSFLLKFPCDVVIDINRINLYILSRALCLPFSPESVENGKIRSEVDLPREFVELNAKNIMMYLLKTFDVSTFPTMEENIEFLNKKREENKQKKLSILNDKTVEENQLISNLKKAGIKNDLMDVKENDEDEKMYDINDMYDNEEKHDEEDNKPQDHIFKDVVILKRLLHKRHETRY